MVIVKHYENEDECINDDNNDNDVKNYDNDGGDEDRDEDDSVVLTILTLCILENPAASQHGI